MQRSRLISLVLFVAVVAVFGRLCFCEFTWYDDPATVHHNLDLNPPTLEKAAKYWTAYGSRAPLALYIPMTYTVWAGLAKLAYIEQPDEAGIHLNPWVYHSANVVVHATSALLVLLILRRLIPHDGAALIGALLFAVHPVQVEAVGWVSGMKDVLSGCLGLLALWQYVLFAQDRSKLHYAFATLAFVAAMLSKPAAIAVPLVALSIDLLVLRRRARESLIALWPWFVLVIPCILWTRAAQPTAQVPVAPLWARPMIALDSLAFYLGKGVAPIGLAVDYGRTPVRVFERGWWWYTWIVPAGVVLGLMLNRKRRGELWAAACIFVAGLLPVLGFTPFLFQQFSGVADHYLYLSMLGPALAAAVLVSQWPTRMVISSCAAILVALSVLTIIQCGVWHDDLTLWSQNVKVNPDSGLARLNLGSAWFRAGDMQRAEHEYREALRVDPDDAGAHDNLSMVLIITGRREQAEHHINRFREITARLSPQQQAQLEAARPTVQDAEPRMRAPPATQ